MENAYKDDMGPRTKTKCKNKRKNGVSTSREKLRRSVGIFDPEPEPPGNAASRPCLLVLEVKSLNQMLYVIWPSTRLPSAGLFLCLEFFAVYLLCGRLQSSLLFSHEYQKPVLPPSAKTTDPTDKRPRGYALCSLRDRQCERMRRGSGNRKPYEKVGFCCCWDE